MYLKMSNLSDAINEEALHETRSCIKLTNKRPLIYDGWNKKRLLSLLKDKLMQHHKMKSLFVCSNARDTSFNEFLHSSIHSGIYNECILLKLEEKNMSPYSIMKAIKYGLLSLSPEELKYFQDFGVETHIIKNMDMWIKKLDEKLIWNLIIAGLTEDQCWNIIMRGLASQSNGILYQLLRSGADILKILNWSGQIKPITSTVIRFLSGLGIDEDTLRYVKENDINDEIEDMLIDLGYNEYRETECLKSMMKLKSQEICRYSLTRLESFSGILVNKTSFLSSISTSTNTQYAPSCKCHINLSTGQDSKVLQKNYLRQNVMTPLSWAIGRALRYQPSDPKHYIAHQLLRWKYGNVPQEEIHNTQQFVASATIAMDQRSMEKRKHEVVENEPVTKNIGCSCLEKLYCIKNRRKYTEVST